MQDITNIVTEFIKDYFSVPNGEKLLEDSEALIALKDVTFYTKTPGGLQIDWARNTAHETSKGIYKLELKRREIQCSKTKTNKGAIQVIASWTDTWAHMYHDGSNGLPVGLCRMSFLEVEGEDKLRCVTHVTYDAADKTLLQDGEMWVE